MLVVCAGLPGRLDPLGPPGQGGVVLEGVPGAVAGPAPERPLGATATVAQGEP